MKKLAFVLAVLAVVVLSGCVSSYVTPGSYRESSPLVKDYEILGFFSVNLEVKQDTEDAQSIKEMALKAAREQYPSAEDIIDITVSQKIKSMYVFFFSAVKHQVNVEGNVIRYTN